MRIEQKKSNRTIVYIVISMVLLILGPLLLGGVASWLGARFSGLFYESGEDSELRNLRRNMTELMLENAILREDAMKAECYRDLLGITRTTRRETIAARILYRTEGLVSGAMTVNKGSEDGVSVNSACVSADGIVGVVSMVDESQSEVLPITSAAVNVSCMTWPSGALGILESSIDGTLQMVHVDISGTVELGEQVLSSRFGGVFPDGLLIGTVVSVNLSESGLEYEIEVAPAVDFSRVGEILILLSEDI